MVPLLNHLRLADPPPPSPSDPGVTDADAAAVSPGHWPSLLSATQWPHTALLSVWPPGALLTHSNPPPGPVSFPSRLHAGGALWHPLHLTPPLFDTVPASPGPSIGPLYAGCFVPTSPSHACAPMKGGEELNTFTFFPKGGAKRWSFFYT